MEEQNMLEMSRQWYLGKEKVCYASKLIKVGETFEYCKKDIDEFDMRCGYNMGCYSLRGALENNNGTILWQVKPDGNQIHVVGGGIDITEIVKQWAYESFLRQRDARGFKSDPLFSKITTKSATLQFLIEEIVQMDWSVQVAIRAEEYFCESHTQDKHGLKYIGMLGLASLLLPIINGSVTRHTLTELSMCHGDEIKELEKLLKEAVKCYHV